MSPGQTGFVPGTKWVRPRDKPRFSPCFTQWKPSLSLGQTRFVPGTFRLGRKVAERKFPELFEFSSRILTRILLRIFPNFSRTFRASFRGRRKTEKFHQESPPFFNVKFPRQTREKTIHKILLESRQSNKWHLFRAPAGFGGIEILSSGADVPISFVTDDTTI